MDKAAGETAAKDNRTSAATRARRTGPRADNRRKQLLEAAAELFSTRGYAGTSIRDIADAVGMLPGSIYYHFRSKEELLLAVHGEGVRLIMDAVNRALGATPADPWTRLEAAAEAHLKGLLTGGKFSMVVTPEFSRSIDEPLRTALIEERDRYEQIFRDLIDDLPLPPDVSRSYLRLSLLGSLNWVVNWYNPEGDDPETIARRMLGLLRRPLES